MSTEVKPALSRFIDHFRIAMDDVLDRVIVSHESPVRKQDLRLQLGMAITAALQKVNEEDNAKLEAVLKELGALK